MNSFIRTTKLYLHSRKSGRTAMRAERSKGHGWLSPTRDLLSIMITRAVALTVIFLLSACTPEDDPPPPEYPSLFDRNFGLQVTGVPPTLANGTPNVITFVARPHYSGTGFFTLEGAQGYGHVTAPVAADFGSINCRVAWVAGQTTAVDWTAEFINSPSPTVIAAVAWMDSLDIGGVRYPVDALEVRQQIGSDILHVLYREISIERTD